MTPSFILSEAKSARRIALGSFNSLYYTIEYPVSALNVSLDGTYFAYHDTSSHRNNRFILCPRLFTSGTTEPRTGRIATSNAGLVSALPAHSQGRVEGEGRAGHDIQHGA